jgi:hypothetical protein
MSRMTTRIWRRAAGRPDFSAKRAFITASGGRIHQD